MTAEKSKEERGQGAENGEKALVKSAGREE
jgi:hypothetical protein